MPTANSDHIRRPSTNGIPSSRTETTLLSSEGQQLHLTKASKGTETSVSSLLNHHRVSFFYSQQSSALFERIISRIGSEPAWIISPIPPKISQESPEPENLDRTF